MRGNEPQFAEFITLWKPQGNDGDKDRLIAPGISAPAFP